jgi:hypothetical protein
VRLRPASSHALSRQITGSSLHNNVVLTDEVASVVPSGLNDGEVAARPDRGSPKVWRVATSTSRVVEMVSD